MSSKYKFNIVSCSEYNFNISCTFSVLISPSSCVQKKLRYLIFFQLSPRSAGVPLQNLPHLKPAPFITNTKHPGGPVGTPQTPAPSASGGVVMTPMSPNIPQQQPTAVHSMSSPLGPGSQPPNIHQPPSSIQAPKNVAAVSRMPMDPVRYLHF